MPAFAGPLAELEYESAATWRNHRLINTAAGTHIHHGAVVADVTYGRGKFWTGSTRHFHLIGSDIEARGGCHVAADFRQLPYPDASIDVVVLDPPYLPYAGRLDRMDKRFRTGTGLNEKQILALYQDGITEAARALKPAGMLWVKGMNIKSGVLADAEVRITRMAAGDGFTVADRLTLTGVLAPQMHKESGNDSWLLVLELSSG